MQVRYGIDAALDGDDRSIRHGGQRHGLGQVAAVRVALVTRSPDEYGTDVDDDTYIVDETIFDPVDDRRVRQVFITTNAHSEPIAMNHATTSFDLSHGSQRGAALIVAMVMLLAMTVLGVTAVRNTNLQERMAGNLRDSNLAFQSAERALREGETFLRSPTIPPFTGANGLLTMQDDAGQGSFWRRLMTGPETAEPRPGVLEVASAPLYVIEEMPPVPVAGGSERFGPLPDVGFYRVTAQAVGGTADAVAILQTTYRR